MNVITPLVRYARKYLVSVEHHDIYERDQRKFERFERYKYVYDNFEYLTGLNVEDVMGVISLKDYEKDLTNTERVCY